MKKYYTWLTAVVNGKLARVQLCTVSGDEGFQSWYLQLFSESTFKYERLERGEFEWQVSSDPELECTDWTAEPALVKEINRYRAGMNIPAVGDGLILVDKPLHVSWLLSTINMGDIAVLIHRAVHKTQPVAAMGQKS